MMRIQKYLIVFVVILSFVSCKGTDEESCSIIDFDEAQVIHCRTKMILFYQMYPRLLWKNHTF